MTKKLQAGMPADEKTAPAGVPAGTHPAETCTAVTAETDKPDEQPADDENTSPSEQAPETGVDRPDETDTVEDAVMQAEIALEEQNAPFAAKAEALFAVYPHVNTFWFTSDVTAFFNENDARNHAATLDNRSITKTVR